MPAHVLVLESSPELRKMLEEGLGDQGYVVTATSSAEEALATLRRQSADLVIADPPVGHGKESGALERIQTEFPQMPSIVMSRERFDPSILAPPSTDTAPRRLLRKPFTLNELLVLTRRMLPLDPSSTATE